VGRRRVARLGRATPASARTDLRAPPAPAGRALYYAVDQARRGWPCRLGVVHQRRPLAIRQARTRGRPARWRDPQRRPPTRGTERGEPGPRGCSDLQERKTLRRPARRRIRAILEARHAVLHRPANAGRSRADSDADPEDDASPLDTRSSVIASSERARRWSGTEDRGCDPERCVRAANGSLATERGEGRNPCILMMLAAEAGATQTTRQSCASGDDLRRCSRSSSTARGAGDRV